MVKGLVLEIEYLCECQSTQIKLIEDIKSFKKSPPCALIADYQSNGIGSRANSWQSPKGNLYLSFALNENDLPKDLEPASASIYFAFILVLTLRDMGSKLWLKWPNDIYLGNRKIAGIITTKSKGVYISLARIDYRYVRRKGRSRRYERGLGHGLRYGAGIHLFKPGA